MTPENAPYKRAQRRNEERFRTRGKLLWPWWKGTMRVRPPGRKMTKAEKKAAKNERQNERKFDSWFEHLAD